MTLLFQPLLLCNLTTLNHPFQRHTSLDENSDTTLYNKDKHENQGKQRGKTTLSHLKQGGGTCKKDYKVYVREIKRRCIPN